MAPFHGIQVYEILENGNLLNAIYTNTRLLKKGNPVKEGEPVKKENLDYYYIDNEIARKEDYDDNGVKGLYKCRYIETNESLITYRDLEISKCDEGVYVFKWKKGNTLTWEGLGLMIGTTHISVSYVKA